MEEILRRLVAFRTVADDPSAMHQGIDYIADFVAARGWHVERFELNGHESLVATTQPGRKTPTVLLAGHLDVVAAPDELFELHKIDGKLYGRGVLDMKYAIAAYLQIIDEQRENLQNMDMGLMITTDEELGGEDGTAKLVAEGYLPKVCIMPDGGDDWQIQLFAKGVLHFQFQSHGTATHGSRPWMGVNAILPLMQALGEVQALFTNQSIDTPTCNIGKIQGGSAINQVPDYAIALVDVRVSSSAEKETLCQQIQDICASHAVDVSLLIDGAVASFSLDNPYIASFAQLVSEVTGVEVKGSRTLGSNDTRFFMPYNVPCISLYPTGAGHHSSNEWISEEAFHQFKTILDRYLDKFARL